MAGKAWIGGVLAAAALAAVVGTWAAYSRDMADARARIEGRSTVVQSPWGPIEYATLGEGPPVLAIHGSGGGFDQGLAMIGPLAKHGYRLIAPSRFGYLRSGRPADASPEVQADALAWLVSHLGEERVIVAGGSAGALPALQFAIRHPDRTQAVVVLVPAAYAPDRPPGENAMGGPVGEALTLTLLRSDFLFWAAIKLFPDAMTQAVLATDPALVHAADAAEQARVKSILQGILPVTRRAAGLADDTRWAGTPPPYPLARIEAPLLAVSLQDDLYGTYAAARHTAAGAPNGRFVGYRTGGHVWVGRETEIWDAVARFLVETEPVAQARAAGQSAASN
ncbi:MAG: alpha/beta fold hydrolase [Phenylobacterium sp.]|uniref:alpha/beta fold hydrolase n=1 Tax=Phenylobacterium sp. TaxID=1871053 RepID=UPI00391B9ECC